MRGLVIATFAAIVTSTGCGQPPQTPAEAPSADETSSAAVEQPAPAPPTREMPPVVVEQPASGVAAERPVEAPAIEPPPAAQQSASSATAPSPAAADTDRQPPPSPPEEEVAARRTDEPPAPAGSVDAAAPSEASEPTAATAPPAPASMPAESPTPDELDLAGLEQRLRDTRAIGVFTKLSLKNQVDDLLDQFRAFYNGQLQVQLAELRERYELLVFKVLTLVQDSDRELANAIAQSREAIWDILSDPQKLAQI